MNERVLDCLRDTVIGGGEGHTPDIGLADADVVVNDRGGLLSALEGAPKPSASRVPPGSTFRAGISP